MTQVAEVASTIPDSRGLNLYRADRDAAALFAHYLPGPLFGTWSRISTASVGWPAVVSTSSPPWPIAIRRF